jgi:hypothetical protein
MAESRTVESRPGSTAGQPAASTAEQPVASMAEWVAAVSTVVVEAAAVKLPTHLG